MTPVQAIARYVGEQHVDDAVQLLDERQIEQFGMWIAEIESITAGVSLAPIASKADEGRAAELLNRGAIALKQLDDLRVARVKPLNEEVRAVNGLFRALTEKIEVIAGKGGKLERLLLEWRRVEKARIQREQEEAQRKQREAAEAEAAALQKAAAAKTDKQRQAALALAEVASRAQATAALAQPDRLNKGVRTDSGTVGAREVWRFEVVDAEAVPRMYLEISEQKIRAAVASGIRQIPGVNIYEDEALTRRPGQ